MAVYFKFKSAKDFDSVSIDGHFISVGTLKEKIVEQKKLGRGSDFNLVISNAQTEEEYTDDGFLVPKNTSVIVRRVPGRPSMPIVADVKDERKSAVAGPPVSNGFEKLESTQNITLSSTVDALDDFGVDLYADPVVVQAHSSLAEEEDSKIRAFVDATASDWQRQTQEGFSGGKGYGTKGQGRGLPLRGGYGGRGLEKRNPPHGYVCHRCGIPGHYIQHCPTNGDPQYDVKKVKPPTGIPKTMLVANPDGSYALPTGEVAVLKPNEAVFEKEVEGLPSSVRQILDVPPEFTCPLCKGVLKNAVLTSKCCFKSFCDDCIRNEIISKGQCVCGTKNILADDLLPNRTLREAIDRVLEAQVSGATSSGLVGSRAQLPDMESARHARSKLPSPGLSISLKEASSTMVASDGSDTTKPNAGENFTAETAGSPAAVTKSENASGLRPSNQAGASNAARDVKGVDDVAPESQLTDPVQDVVSSENQMKSDVQNRDQGLNVAEPAKGKKKPKVKRARTGDQGFKRDAADGMWDQGPNPNYMYNNPMMQPENFCVHCGSYQHPSWNCYMVNGPGPAHPPMHGPMFGPRFHPEMRGMMHPPMGDGYGMPYHPNAGPFNDYGVPPYDFHMNGPMMPMQEPFMPPAMMPYGPPPMQRDSIEPGPLSRDEFEAKKAELKRRREREQRFGREHVKYASSEFDMGPPRVHGNGAPRIPNVSERDRERDVSPDAHGHRQAPGRLDHTGERRQYVRVRPSKVKDDWTDNEEIQHSSDEGSAHGEYPAADSIERWSSRHADEGISGDMMRDIRFTRDGVGHYSSNYKHQANGDTSIPTSMRFGHKRSVSRYESDEEDDTRRQSGNQVGPSSPSRTALPRIAASDDRFPREIKNNSSDPNGSGGRRQAGEKVGKIIDLRERPRGSVFERTNLASKPRGAVDEDYAVIDEREFSRLKRAEAARNNRATENRTQGGRDTDEGTWQRTAVVSRKRRLVEAS